MIIEITEEERDGIVKILRDQINRWSGLETTTYTGSELTRNFNIDFANNLIIKLNTNHKTS